MFPLCNTYYGFGSCGSESHLHQKPNVKKERLVIVQSPTLQVTGTLIAKNVCVNQLKDLKAHSMYLGNLRSIKNQYTKSLSAFTFPRLLLAKQPCVRSFHQVMHNNVPTTVCIA